MSKTATSAALLKDLSNKTHIDYFCWFALILMCVRVCVFVQKFTDARVSHPLELELKVNESCSRGWELKLGSLQEQHARLTKKPLLFLQPFQLIYSFIRLFV